MKTERSALDALVHSEPLLKPSNDVVPIITTMSATVPGETSRPTTPSSGRRTRSSPPAQRNGDSRANIPK